MDENFEETPSMWVMLGLLLAIFILMAVVVMIAFTAMNLSMATHRVGARGASGQSGISGPSGFAGGTSAPGAKGAAGASGASGSISGPSGPSGIPGKQGPSGVPSNTSGPSGVSGFSGPQGSRGASGFLNFPVMVRTFSARLPGAYDQANPPALYPITPAANWIYVQKEDITGREYVWVGGTVIWSEFDSSNANIVTTAAYPASSQIEINVQNDPTIAGTYLLEIVTGDVADTSVTVVISPNIIILQGREVTTGTISIPFPTFDSFNPVAQPVLQPASFQSFTGWPSYPLIYTLTRNTDIFENAQTGVNVNASFTYQTLLVIPSSTVPLYLAIYYQQKSSPEPGQTAFLSPNVPNPAYFPPSFGIPQASMTFTRISSNTSTVPYQ